MAEKNRTRLDYPQDSLERVRAGLLFVAVKLGDLLDEIVVVGGVVPSLLVDQRVAGQQHVGTTDLDLALSLSVLSEEKYRDISGRLRDACFAPAKKEDGKIIRQTWEKTGKLGRITVDFLIPRSDKADPKRLLQDLERDFGAIRTRGSSWPSSTGAGSTSTDPRSREISHSGPCTLRVPQRCSS